ncbi:Lrp/AsnC family transcriptional regulator [Chenggangzhangella methanolivorans]|uniref:Lrp/AsnC ligand binding domain-containing protein n=1 Tax=Chenggangzhangella methanolivorans TaxID=1437009 RepID=A0A9E6URD0_9HYPH|nr:Lrp/AsnC ligand binding domain-containing protein [Chenggangzhangella methanolivorans]QZO02135.1 Lrp/AsnC ligand binding domain-containing protein [Chenggangzhangella methanolivorans]
MKDPSAAEFDRIDLKILRALHADGRLTNAELAVRAGVSAATCHRRTQQLLENGHITGFRAEVAPVSVGLGALVMIGVILDRSSPDSRNNFEEAVLKVKEILDCILVAGEFDYFLKIRARDIADFNKLQSQTLIALPGVQNTRTFFVMKEVKENARLTF